MVLKIIGGRYKNERLYSCKGCRPILARVKKSLFDIINKKLKGAYILDLFAGTGSVGLEAISRGSAKAVFVDSGAQQVNCILRNAKKLGVGVEVYKRNILKGLKWLNDKFDLIFITPPYGNFVSSKVLKIINKSELLEKDGWIIVQHSKREKISTDDFSLFRQEKYGETVLSFFKR